MKSIECVLLWLLLFSVGSESKKARQKWRERNLQEQCKLRNKYSRVESTASGPVGGPLQLQAFLDLNKGIVCFKVESCNRPPVCIVEAKPELKGQRLNDCSLWNQFISILSQPTRKIEPIIIGENNRHARGKSTWYHPRRVWPDEIYSMCRRTIVYRFLSNPQNSTNSTGQPSGRASASAEPSTQQTITARTRSGTTRRRNVRVGRRRTNRPRRFRLPSCMGHGMNIPCSRICVGQEKDHRNSASCSTFKIKCTFRRTVEGTLQGNPPSMPRSRASWKKTKSARKPRD